MAGRLQGLRALVTGGGTGIGAAVALDLAGHGADLCLVGRNLNNLEAVGRQLRAKGVQAACVRADLSEPAEVESLIDRIRSDNARLDILVHNAAQFVRSSVAFASLDDLDVIYRSNIRAPLALTQGLLGRLKESRGQVVFVNSSSGLNAKAGTVLYDLSKHALKAMADSLRAEVNADGVRVLSVYPGRTASEMQAKVHSSEGKPYRPELLLQPADIAAVVVHALGLLRTAEVTDINIRPMHIG